MSTFEKRRDEAARKWSEGWNPATPWTETTITKNFRQGADWARAETLKDAEELVKALENYEDINISGSPNIAMQALATWRERTGK